MTALGAMLAAPKIPMRRGFCLLLFHRVHKDFHLCLRDWFVCHNHPDPLEESRLILWRVLCPHFTFFVKRYVIKWIHFQRNLLKKFHSSWPMNAGDQEAYEQLSSQPLLEKKLGKRRMELDMSESRVTCWTLEERVAV